MEELDALNVLLRAIGSSPVHDVDTLHPDAANALSTLTRKRKQIQRRGWWFNQDYNTVYQPDTDGRIALPEALTTVVFRDTRYINRGDKVYDKMSQTYIINQSVEVTRQVRILDWDDLPDIVQEVIMYASAEEFVRDELEDPTKEQSFNKSAAVAMMDMKKQDLEEGQYNMFSSSRTRQARYRVQPYGRFS